MPPANAPKRKAPAFKPPRPVNAATTSATATTAKATAVPRTSTVKKSAGTSATKSVQPVRSGFKPATTLISSEPEDDDGDMDDMEVDPSEDEANDASGGTHVPEASQDEVKPAIPPKLLARLLHEGFEDKDVRIGKEAMAVIGKYMETFVREAIARAGYERRETEGDGGISDGFLQVEDLEKLAPQLLLDF